MVEFDHAIPDFHSVMSAPNNPEIKGTLQESPFAELLAETSQAGLSGSFRLQHQNEKAIIYLRNGEIIFAVSNLRQHRLFEILLQSEKLTKEVITSFPNFTNDIELAENLINGNILTKPFIEDLLNKLIKEIIQNVFQWNSGEWVFSHLARAREILNLRIDISKILLDYSRNLSNEAIIKRFKSFEERFTPRETFSVNLDLMPQEAYIFSRLDNSLMRIHDIKNISGLSDTETLKTLYILWLGGFITRKNWNSVFSENKIKEILSAKLTLKTDAPKVAPQSKVTATTEVSTKTEPIEPKAEETPEAEIDEKKLLLEYLDRVEKAESYYEILDVPIKARVPAIKTAYFGLAKKYHPDKFHQELNSEILQRVQNAFTEIARAYETLKDDSTREVYDFKLRKYLETVKERTAGSDPSKPEVQIDRAREEFDQGFDYLMNEDYEKSIPFLTRAVQMAPDNARYHAYYGKSLSFVGNQRHKAESEIQTAIRLDSSVPTYRIMLAEFYIQFNLLKRAEGELQRLLLAFPNNREAQALLDSLAK